MHVQRRARRTSTASQFVEFGHKDVVRHKLVQRIVEAYKEHTDERNRVISVEVDNRSGVEVDEAGAVELAGRVLRAEGIDDGELGLAFVGAGRDARAEARAPRDRRGDRRALVPDRRPRRAARRRAARARRRRPLPAGRRRGVALAADARPAAPARLRPRRRDGARARRSCSHERAARADASSTRSTTRSRGSSTCSARSGTCGSTSRSRSSCSSPR